MRFTRSKGRGGAFGLEDLVGFAHKFETVLDAVRSHELVADEKLMPVLLRSGDVLIELIESARMETSANQEAVDTTSAALAEFLPDEDEDPEEEFSFQPMVLAIPETDDDGTEPDEQVGFRITFSPARAFYEVGNDPLHLLKALADLGTLNVAADLSQIPDDIDTSDWENGYLSWNIQLETPAADDTVKAVFGFVEDLATVSILPMRNDGTTMETSSQDDAAAALGKAKAQAPDDPPTQKTEAPAKTEIKEDQAAAAPKLAAAEKPKAKPAPTVGGQKSPPSAATREAKATLRVDLERVDRLINAVGELIINQSVIAQRIEDAGLGKSDDIQVDLEDYKHLAREIQEGVMAIRAQPVKPLFQRMARIVREVTSATGKKVKFETIGESTEVDKTLVERLSDPLTHMIRNAIDHGIEESEKRVEIGKDATGLIQLSAEHRSGNVMIEITDDGAGLNRDRIKSIAIEKGIIAEDADLSIAEIDQLLFAPGFSTAKEVTNLSGRGVGMDVVKTAITSLGGRISINSTPGKGSTFSIALPLTLAVMDGMVVDVAKQTMVIPIASVSETIRPRKENIFMLGVDHPVLHIRGEYIPIIDLGTALGHPPRDTPMEDRVFLLVRTEQITQCAIAVDGISDQRQVVIKSLEGDYGKITGISAATILGDGKIALIVDPDGIASSVSDLASPRALADLTPIAEPAHV
ncbi:MAG: chemotaxis protein CheA [Pseudomonadota bacterium]